jgi:hypothetical protein
VRGYCLARGPHRAANRGRATDHLPTARNPRRPPRSPYRLSHKKRDLTAETWQAEIASWATSGAEGLAAMAEVHELKLARAWLLFASGADRSRARVRQLCAELERDPNGIAARLRPHLAALKAELR